MHNAYTSHVNESQRKRNYEHKSQTQLNKEKKQKQIYD